MDLVLQDISSLLERLLGVAHFVKLEGKGVDPAPPLHGGAGEGAITAMYDGPEVECQYVIACGLSMISVVIPTVV